MDPSDFELVVDAANVIGSRPDGWWRDRAAAARRLLARIDEALGDGRLSGPVVVVLEGAARPAADRPETEKLQVIAASGSGDDAVVTEVRESGKRTAVVTADRELMARVQRLGATVEAPGWFLSLIEPTAPLH